MRILLPVSCLVCVQCRERRTSYTGKLHVQLSWSVNGCDVGGLIERAIGDVPIMVKVKLSRYRITDLVAFESTCVALTAVVRVQSDRTDAKTVGGAGRGGTGVRWILHHQWKRKAHSNAHHAKAPSSEFYLQLAYILYHHVMLSSPQPTTLNRPSWKARGPLYSEFGVQIRCLAPTGIGLVRIKATMHCNP